jgi:putative endonuclease
MYVYILANKSNTTIYIGVTHDLSTRIQEHKSKKHPNSFTSKYNVSKLVYFELYDNSVDAIFREKQIKKYSRQKKNILVDSRNPNWEEIKFGS